MYYIIHTDPKSNVLRWLNSQVFSFNKISSSSIPIEAFNSRHADLCEGIAVNSWEAINQVEKFYDGVMLFQGKKPSYNSLLGMCCYIVNRNTGHRTKLVCLPSNKQLFLKQYKVLHIRYLKKLVPSSKQHFIPSAEANLRYFEDGKAWEYLESFSSILFLAIDTETKEEARLTDKKGNESLIQGVIDLVSCTAVYLEKGEWVLRTIITPFLTWADHASTAAMCASPYPKVFQNGLYDVEYFTNWHCSVFNWCWDTEYYARSITSDFVGAYKLASLAGQWCEEAYYWKELTSFKGTEQRNKLQQQQYINYSGLDAHWTAMIALNQLVNYNKFNIFNFILRSKFTPLCLWLNQQGLEINQATHLNLAIKYSGRKEEGMKKFRDLTGFNVGQSAEILPLLQKMAEVAKHQGIEDVGRVHSTDVKAIDGLKVSHPMFGWFINLMSSTRTADKWTSTFINFKQFKGFNDKYYFKYCLNCFTTASMRLACKSSNMWCGGNAQNVNLNLRQMWIPPKGYVLFSIDAPSAEAYTTAYLADEEVLIKVLVDPNIDFHKYNGSAIFEIPYEEITGPKRKLSKPIGFGYFYGMLGGGMLMTMGVEAVRALKLALGLTNESLIKVCGITVKKINGLYPKIRGSWYYQQLSKVIKFGRLPFQSGFAPVICGNVLRDKTELNSVMSLEPQGMSADINLGGCNNVLLNLLRDDIDDLGIIPVVQIHDELIGYVPEDLDLDKADEYLQACFQNARKMKSGKVMRIPEGVPVYALDGKALKADEVPRGDWTKGLRVKDIIVEKYAEVIPKYDLDFDVKDVEYLLED